MNSLHQSIRTTYEHTIVCITIEKSEGGAVITHQFTSHHRRIEDAIIEFRAMGWRFSKKRGGWVCPICWDENHPTPVWELLK